MNPAQELFYKTRDVHYGIRGTKTKVKLPHTDFGLYNDPWDGKQGKANYPGE